QKPVEQIDGCSVTQRPYCDDLAYQIEAEHDARDKQERAHLWPAAPGRSADQTSRWPIGVTVVVVLAPAQRRSWRCLHDMHSVARGKACRRILPIGLPQDSQTP